MPTIGQRFNQNTELHCSRCSHLQIVQIGNIVKPCSVCMHIEFQKSQPSELSEGNTVEIGLNEAEIAATICDGLTLDSKMDNVKIESISRAISQAIYKNNRRLQIDIEAAFRYLKD